VNLDAILLSHCVNSGTFGVFDRRIARRIGFTDHQVRRRRQRGSWEKLHPGVYRLAGRDRDHRATLLAATMAARGMVSHASAAWLWKLRETHPMTPHVSVHGSAYNGIDGVCTHRVSLGALAFVDRIPVTSPYRTLLDCCRCDDAARLVDAALRLRLVTPAGLAEYAAFLPARGAPGSGAFRRLIATRGSVTASVLEDRFRDLCSAAGIPMPEFNRRIHAGGILWEIDASCEPAPMAVELDSRRWHSDRHTRVKDQRKEAAFEAEGWWFSRFTWDDIVGAPGVVTGRLTRSLAQRMPRDREL